MEQNAQEQKLAKIWLCIAGPVAIAVVFALYTVNNQLSESKVEQELGATLQELRTAQTEIKSRFSDDRQTNEAVLNAQTEAGGLRVVTNHDIAEAGHEEHAH